MRVRIARDELRRMRELTQTIKALEAEIAELVAQVAPQLLAEPGFGPLTAAKLVGEIAGAERFATDAKLARAAGVAPIPVSSGKHQPPPPRPRRQPPDQRRASTASPSPAPRCHPETQRLHRPQDAPKARPHREAIRCLKRHLARRVWHLLQPPHPVRDTASPSIS